mgnify:CR=1 FL=1
MERRNRFVTFLVALLPGAGYMYFGMLRFGIEIMVLFFMVQELFDYIGLGFISYIFCVPVWLYTFFDTYKIANKYDIGETIQDKSMFSKNQIKNINATNGGWLIFAWFLIIVGILALVNKFFGIFDIFYTIKQYFIPVFFILIGIYLLVKGKEKMN